MTANITPNIVVSMPSQLFTMPDKFSSVFNGRIYLGEIDKDPINPANQIPVYVENEDGSHVLVDQPIKTNSGGYPVYNGKPAKFVTEKGYSMKVTDSIGGQLWYFPNILKYDPDQFKQWFLPKYEGTQWNNFVYDFGGVHDYSGTPMYDGKDQSRISATDNSPALQKALNDGEVRDGVLNIYFPSGHYGFRSDGVSKAADKNVHTVIFHGDGKDNTVLDFIFERSDTIGDNVQPLSASMLARLSGFKRVVWKDLLCKCTTKSGPIDGSTDPSASNPSVYYGAVWFAHHQDCDNVRFDSIGVAKCNYRGMSIDASGKPIGNRTKVSIINSDGFDNTSTGFWLSYCNSLFINGGEFYHNGTRGLLATGYGVAASQYVDDVLIVGGAHFYENYRKGFDRHGGVGSITINGCVFADNLLRDVEDNKQYSNEYPLGKVNNNYFTSCDFFLNRNTQWLEDALKPVSGNQSTIKVFVSTLDRTISGELANRQGECKFTSCNVKVEGDFPDGYAAFNGFNIEAKVTEFSGTTIDTSGFKLLKGVTGDVYSSWFFNTPYTGATLRLQNSSIMTHSGSIINSRNGMVSNGVFLVSPSSANMEIENSSIDLLDFVLAGTSSAGNVLENQCKRAIVSSDIRFRDLRLVTHNNSFLNAFSWLNSGFGFKSGRNNECINDSSISVGSSGPSQLSVSGGNGKLASFSVPSQDRPAGSEFEVITGITDGNVFVELNGALDLNSDKYISGWRYSSWTQTVYAGSKYIGMEKTGTKPIKLDGVDTNFIATRLRIYWATPSTGVGGWYNGKISAATAYLPLIITE